MSTWVIISWICVLVLTGINIFLFVKLKSASEQMLKVAFPGAKNMSEALAGMQQMMQGLGGRGGGGNPLASMPSSVAGGGKNMDAQLKAAMSLLQNMQKKGGKK